MTSSVPTAAQRRGSGTRLLVLLSAALAAVLALLLPARSASAATLTDAGSRVRVITPASTVIVGVHECITAGQHWVRGPSQAQVTVGSCVAAEDVAIDLHHTVPSEILKMLPEDVASNPLVRGRAGAPNRWPVPSDVHVDIHAGPGGGAYNQAWKGALADLGRPPTVDDVLRLREQITKQFGIDIFKP